MKGKQLWIIKVNGSRSNKKKNTHKNYNQVNHILVGWKIDLIKFVTLINENVVQVWSYWKIL